MKPSGSFASKVRRFGAGGFINENEEAPGPGQYHKSDDWTAKRSGNVVGFKSKDNKQQMVMQSMQNPPSIPSHNAVFGYNEDDRGRLIRSDAPE